VLHPFTGLHSGRGQGKRDGQWHPLRGNALCQIAPDGAVTAYLTDLSIGAAQKWQGKMVSTSEFLLWSPVSGGTSNTIFGRAQFEPTGALIVDMAAAGVGMVPEQWRFRLAPHHGYGVAGW
jgi:hypothetical protein